jgi:hypothetical protein
MLSTVPKGAGVSPGSHRLEPRSSPARRTLGPWAGRDGRDDCGADLSTHSRPLGVGVIGSGFGRSTQIPLSRAPGVEVVAVVSRQAARA